MELYDRFIRGPKPLLCGNFGIERRVVCDDMSPLTW